MAQAVFTTSTITRSATLWSDFPENILLPPIELSGRKDYKDADIAALAAEIKARGQDTPVMVRKTEAGKPLLVYGRRRYLAVQYLNQHLLAAGESKIKLEAKYESKMTDTEALIAAISENSKRKDVNDMDHCANIERLMKLSKYTLENVAGIYFPEAADAKAKADALRWVRERAGLVELAPEAAQAVRNEEIKITTAKELAKLPQDEQRKVLADAKAAKSTLAGKARLKVKDVKKAKTNASPAKPTKAKGPDPDDVPFDAPGPVVLAALPSNPILAAAETMARAVEMWATDATDKAEKALFAALKAYRALAPLKQASGKAA